jgi:hypothetical protein
MAATVVLSASLSELDAVRLKGLKAVRDPPASDPTTSIVSKSAGTL